MCPWLCPLIFVLGVIAGSLADAAEYPARAERYKRDLIQNAELFWGIDAPIPLFAAQIHQESAWKPDAKSPYANGLAQFTPATADWISGIYPALAANAPFSPQWALKAVVIYDKHLYAAVTGSTDCDRWAFTLSSYNGGLGNLKKDMRLCAAFACEAPTTVPGSGGSMSSHLRKADFRMGLPRSPFIGNRDFSARLVRVALPKEMVVSAESLMQPVMLTMGDSLKVIWEKVRSVFIKVMDEDGAVEFDAQALSSNKPMDVLRTTIPAYRWIPVEQEDGLRIRHPNHSQDGLLNVTEVGDVHTMSIIRISEKCCNPEIWWDNVEKHSKRAKWAIKENRDYPRKILLTHQPKYARWGRNMICTSRFTVPIAEPSAPSTTTERLSDASTWKTILRFFGISG